MEYKQNPKLVSNARKLRKNMTKEERHLWYDFLKDYPVRFYRQKILGRYIVDFYCADAKLVVELDGSQHYDPEAMKKEYKRTAFLEQYDLRVLRIPNNEVMKNVLGVCEHIDYHVRKRVQREV